MSDLPAWLDNSVHPAGMSPRQATFFLARARKKAKNTGPLPRPALRSGCPAMLGLGGTARNALRSLRSLRLNGRAESDVERALRALPPSPALLGAPQGQQPNSQQPNSQQPGNGAQDVATRAVRYLAVGCSPSVAAEQRSGLGRARSAHPLLDQGGRSNGESVANGVRSALLRQRREQRRESPAAGRGLRSGRVFFAYFLARARK